jgi:hypothetical protein
VGVGGASRYTSALYIYVLYTVQQTHTLQYCKPQV